MARSPRVSPVRPWWASHTSMRPSREASPEMTQRGQPARRSQAFEAVDQLVVSLSLAHHNRG
jgi:hypothetical protein